MLVKGATCVLQLCVLIIVVDRKWVWSKCLVWITDIWLCSVNVTWPRILFNERLVEWREWRKKSHLTHWGLITYAMSGHQDNSWTNSDSKTIGPAFFFMVMHFIMSPAQWQPCSPGRNALDYQEDLLDPRFGNIKHTGTQTSNGLGIMASHWYHIDFSITWS